MLNITSGMSGAQVRAALNGAFKWYDIRDYGGVGDNATDNSTPLYDLILAIIAGGGGVGFLPNGIYDIAGPLITSLGGQNPNCQVPIPADAFSANRCMVRLVGESVYHWNTGSPIGVTPNGTKGVILNSTLTSASGTNPAVIGSSGGALITSFHDIVLENMNIRVKSTANGPVLSGLNGEHMSMIHLKDFSVIVDVSFQNSNDPVNECAGIILGRSGNGMCGWKNGIVYGFKYGLIAAEHASLDEVCMIGNKYGLVLPQSYYTVRGGTVTLHWNQTQIFSPNAAVMGITNGNNVVAIDALDIEVITGTGKWYDYGDTLIDAGNNIYGKIRYVIGKALTGTDYGLFSKSGGTHVLLERAIDM
jgi:hypothetical protein